MAEMSLELNEQQMRELVDLATGHVVELLTTLPEQAMDGTDQATGEFLASIAEPLPQTGEDAAVLLERLFREYAPRTVNTISGGFMAYIGCGGLFHAAVADLVADSLNRYTGAVAVAPTMAVIESTVVRWFCGMMGLPSESSGGFLTSGGSMANLSAVITARTMRLGEEFSRGTVYISDQAHHCVEKAARLAGIPSRNLRIIESDDRFRLDPERVCAAISQDRAAGLQPFLLVASAGTTNAGAIDPLGECADLARRENLWFHVDGAYGGFFMLTERGRRALQGIGQADSIVLDPHKTLFLPYGTGALVVRDRNCLRQTHFQEADYMPPPRDDTVLLDPCELSPELTKPFRGLRAWLPLKMHGVGPFRDALDEKLDLIRWMEDQLSTVPGIEIITPAQLTVITFTLADDGRPREELNHRSRELLLAINRRQNAYLSGTWLKGVFAVRIAVISFRTHRQHLEALLKDIRELVAKELETAHG